MHLNQLTWIIYYQNCRGIYQVAIILMECGSGIIQRRYGTFFFICSLTSVRLWSIKFYPLSKMLNLNYHRGYVPVQSKVRGRFRKILWPSQNIWTLYVQVRFSNLTYVHNQAQQRIRICYFIILLRYKVDLLMKNNKTGEWNQSKKHSEIKPQFSIKN